MKRLCNPIDVAYTYQFDPNGIKAEQVTLWREHADPSMICYHGMYYIFVSMSAEVLYSTDLCEWKKSALPDGLPVTDYAPDVRVIGDYVYYCASRIHANCDWYRTRDVLHGPYEKISGTFSFWDPHLFCDDDGKLYFYWGCSNNAPIWGVELDRESMKPGTEPKAMVQGNPAVFGFERIGENNSIAPATEDQIKQALEAYAQKEGLQIEDLLPAQEETIRSGCSKMPFIEGAWMNKHNGRYYLQYAFAGTEFNTYGNGALVSDHPLGPFVHQRNNPYSFSPGSFLPGAGHGSTMEDLHGNLWHTATMRISKTHIFERRIGLWPAGFDEDGELFCNQRYGDWPRWAPEGRKWTKEEIWQAPPWMILSAHKQASASSCMKGYSPSYAVDENVQTWWRPESNDPCQWLQIDLADQYQVHAVQVNLCDDALTLKIDDAQITDPAARQLLADVGTTQWKILGSKDGENWFVVHDYTASATDLPHHTVYLEECMTMRFLRITQIKVPFDQIPCLAGLRVFGHGSGEKPGQPQVALERIGSRNIRIKMHAVNAVGYNVLWGHTRDKLYHSWLTYNEELEIGALVSGETYYFRVDAFNENGITEGYIQKEP